VQVEEYDVTTGDSVRRRMEAHLGRVATPAILIGQRVFWGFEYNKAEIAELLGLEGQIHEHHGDGG
jgi:hypothetical protein